ncbi:MAG: GspE/PulE family protein [Planctomycetota bacterium]|nr:GspE/PulE family protein [Planctomycetota bacterium]MDA1114630.1 GspE/PulE family protein [Planctomycetota bacterium]
MRKLLGEILIAAKAITEDQLRAALALQNQRTVLIGKALIEQGATDEITVFRALAKQSVLPFVDVSERTPPERLTSLLDGKAAWELEALPVAEKEGKLVVAVADPQKAVVVDTLNFLLDREVLLALTTPAGLKTALTRVYGESDIGGRAVKPVSQDGSHNESPIVRLVNKMFDDALDQRASDIHIEPFADRMRIRLRIDGKLKIYAEHPVDVFAPLISHLKVTGGLDIAEKRRPQDGRLEHIALGRNLDVRVSMLPTNNGQTCVMRLLDADANLISLPELGLNEKAHDWFRKLIERPHGIFLVTGPTGSGKTTTLYAALQTLNRPDKKILTVEDPVEYRIPGINQVQVHPRIGLNFSRVLRAFLRQAPNVVLVGEIRDRETAEVAIQASLTGHIVFSTVHTNDAPSAVTRLLDMGVPPFLIATSLQGVLAQRLMRRLCKECSEPEDASLLDQEILQVKPGEQVQRPRGCRKCNGTGYRGRIGAFEWLDMKEELREALFHAKDPNDFVRAAGKSKHWTPISIDAIDKAKSGQTTVEEVLRITKVAPPTEDEPEMAGASTSPKSSNEESSHE